MRNGKERMDGSWVNVILQEDGHRNEDDNKVMHMCHKE